MLDERVLPIALGQGMDTKSDPKLTAKPVLLENAVFTEAGDLVKRNGYDSLTLNIVGGGTLAGPKGIQSVNGELVCFDSGSLYAYSPDQSAWINRGRYLSVGVSDTTIGSSTYGQIHQSQAVLGNYALFTYTQAGSTSGLFETRISVLDISTNTFIVSGLLFPFAPPATISLFKAMPCAKAVTLGSSTLAIVFAYNNSGQANIALTTVSITSSGVSFGVVHTLGTDVVGWLTSLNTTLNDVYIVQFDVATTSTGAVLAYASGSSFSGTPSGLQVKLISSTGFVGATASITSPGEASPLSITVDSSSGTIWVNWVDRTTFAAPTVYTASFTSTLSASLGKTSLDTPGAVVNQITGRIDSAFSQVVYYSIASALVSGAYNLRSKVVSPVGVTTAGALSLNGLDLASKPFQVSGANYMAAIYYSSTDQAVFILSLDTLIAGQALEGSCVAKAFFQNVSSVVAMPCFVPAPIALSATKVGIVAANILQGSGLNATTGSAMATLDFNHPDAYQGKVVADSLVLNGGVVQMYDGNSVVELGFHYPPNLILTPSATGGSMSDGTYEYAAVYEWTDAQGRLHRSVPGFAQTTISGASGAAGSVTVHVSTLRLSQKNVAGGVSISVYRTNLGGVTHFAIALPQPNVSSNELLTLTDLDPSTGLSGELLYTDGNVLENSAPPPSLVMETRNNRLWLIDSENPNTLWPSKTLTTGNGLSFAGELSIDLDTRGGPVTALAELDSNFVLFKASVPFVISGDAGDDTGSNSALSVPVPIQSDVGAVNSRGVISYSGGVMFKTGSGGIYRLDRALGISYLGRDVEAYNSQTITAITRVPGTTQIRFLTSAGATLVYDYLYNQWGTLTNHLGFGADTWNGLYAYARTDGKIYVENQARSFLDAASSYQVRAKLAWIKTAGIQGFQRVKRIGLLGDYLNGSSASHGVQISAAYDYSATFSAPVSYALGGASSGATFQYRERLGVQKCTALQLLIEEVVTGASGEFLSLTDLTLEVGVKRGMRKLPQAQTAG